MLSRIRVFVADDHSLVRAGMERILTDAPDIELSGQASSGEEALSLIPELKPDVVLMDLKLPYAPGQKIARLLHEQFPDIKILVVSICPDEILLQNLFQQGVYGFFPKTGSAEDMLKAIRMVSQGGRYVNQDFAKKTIYNNAKQKLCAFDSLSERELQVVLMLIEGLTVYEVSEKLEVNRKTINSYRSRCFQKLNVMNDVELTLMAYRQGLIKDSQL